MLQYDRDYTSPQVVLGHEPNVDFGDPGGHGEDELLQQSMMGKVSRPSVNYHRENNHYRNLSPQDHHGHASYSSMTSGESIEPISAVHFQAPVYHSSETMRHQEQWQADNDYATALVGSLKIDDDGVGK
jgi:hypothetical protein